ncbi:hypothetical protein FRC11_011181 [Ceratobasidium sp. 423]|nr:hypothetical protein FRC11_011181 [Ceratobasidium sp. 423]
MDSTYAMEAPDMEEFLAQLRECHPRDLAIGFNGIYAFAKYHYKDTLALPEGVYPPKEIKKPTINLPEGVMPWVTSNILE